MNNLSPPTLVGITILKILLSISLSTFSSDSRTIFTSPREQWLSQFSRNQLKIIICNFLCRLPHCLLNSNISMTIIVQSAGNILNQTPFWSFWNGHVISVTTNHWTGKLTELHLCITILWFTDAWLDFSISKSRLICAKLCQIIESKSSKEEKPQCHFQNCSCLSQCSKSHFPTPKKVKSQFLFYPFRTLL